VIGAPSPPVGKAEADPTRMNSNVHCRYIL
jgi:hypothetical protein